MDFYLNTTRGEGQGTCWALTGTVHYQLDPCNLCQTNTCDDPECTKHYYDGILCVYNASSISLIPPSLRAYNLRSSFLYSLFGHYVRLSQRLYHWVFTITATQTSLLVPPKVFHRRSRGSHTHLLSNAA